MSSDIIEMPLVIAEVISRNFLTEDGIKIESWSHDFFLFPFFLQDPPAASTGCVSSGALWFPRGEETCETLCYVHFYLIYLTVHAQIYNSLHAPFRSKGSMKMYNFFVFRNNNCKKFTCSFKIFPPFIDALDASKFKS